MQINSNETTDTPYDSGAIKSENGSALFTSNGNILNYKESKLLDLTADAGSGNSIDTFYAARYSVNGMNVYLLTVFFTQGDTQVPPPYTPFKFYAFTDQGDGALHPVKSWPSDQVFSAVYPFGTKGFYLCSSGRSAGCARWNNNRGWICMVQADLSETTLNGRWKDWNSLSAVGMDQAGDLYLLNTLFSDFDNFAPGTIGAVNPVNDGYYRLDPNGNLTKIYPFVQADQTYVTSSGGIYIDTSWMDGTLHLQTGTRIVPN